METLVVLSDSAQKIFAFADVYSERAAQEQAEKKKLDAFGLMTKLSVWNRPSAESVKLVTWERRLEPFWHVAARREIDYIHEATYSVQILNPHALKIQIEERDFDVTHANGKNHIDIPVKENCHRKTDITLYQSGIQREIKSSDAQEYIGRYKTEVIDDLSELKDAVVTTKPLASVLSTIKSKLATTSVDAHVILSDTIHFEKAHLYYRPVFAFKFAWEAGGKEGVVEVDALSGEAMGNGEWMRDKISNVVTRENMFDIGADVAGIVHPGAGMAVKLIEKITRPK